jgi:hypothetical protein
MPGEPESRPMPSVKTTSATVVNVADVRSERIAFFRSSRTPG